MVTVTLLVLHLNHCDIISIFNIHHCDISVLHIGHCDISSVLQGSYGWNVTYGVVWGGM